MVVQTVVLQKALAEVKVFQEKGEMPQGMNEKPPEEESEGEEENREEEQVSVAIRREVLAHSSSYTEGAGEGGH